MTGLKSITCATDVSDLLVDDARVFHQKAGVVRAEQERRVAATRQALYLANLRYDRGLSTYLDVLDQERRLLRAELVLASTTRDQLTAVVQVYKAPGGGWAVPSGTE